MLTKVFGSPVNFRDGDRKWRAIDTGLEHDGAAGYRIAQAKFDLSLPGALGDGGAVRLAHGGHELSFGLAGAVRSVAEVEGSQAVYRALRPGLDLHYEARPNGVKESLMLGEAAAASDLDFALDAGDLTPEITKSGGVELRDGAGDAAFSIAAPFMRDAAGEISRDVSYALQRAETGWTLSVLPDRSWLDNPARQFPVEVDPTVYVGPQVDCHIDSATPTTSLCGDTEMKVGWNGSTDRRALLKFDVAGAVPKGARVEEGYVALYLQGKSTSTNKPLTVYRATSPWTGSASWNKTNGTTSWTTAGGDFDGAKEWRTSWMGGSGTGQFVYWAIGELIQEWVDGDLTNNGVVLKDRDNATYNNVLRFASSEHSNSGRRPYLGITWSRRAGIERQFTFAEQKLSDRLGVSVNVANGNLVHRAEDLRIAGTGLDLEVSRYFNNLTTSPTTTSGRKAQLSIGGGVMLLSEGGGDRMLIGPTGSRHVFHSKPDGSFKSPTGIDATLATSGGGYQLTFGKTEEIYRFDGPGNLTSIEDRNGNEISFDYSSWGVVDDITDTQGRVIDASYDGDGNLASLEDPTGRDWLYDYDAYDRLTDYTDPSGGITEYYYQGPDNLIEIEDPHGTVTRIGYDGDSRVTSIKRGYNRSNSSYVAQTTFAYSSPTSPCGTGDIGKTVMTDPRGKTTTYCYDAELRVTKTVDANGNARMATFTTNSDADTATAPGSALTDFAYDSLGNLTSKTEPAGEVTAFEYGSGSHPRLPTKETSPQGTSSVFAYDTAGNTTAVADGGSPTQVEEKLEYNGQAGGSCADDSSTKPGTLRCAIDGGGNETRYGYDDAGNLTTITPELPLGETTITYDALSRVDTVEDGKGQVASYSYDALDRVVEIDYGGGETVSFDYDVNGNRVERVDSVHGTSTWAYDVLNRRTADDLPSGDTDYTWDVASNLTSLTDAGGAVTYRYDDVNRLADLAEPGGSCSSPVSLCTTFGYTARDQRERTTYPNGVEQTVTYDASDKPTRVQALDGATELSDFTYDYDEPSPGTRQTKLRQSVTDKDGNETTYAYDFLDRLTGAVERDGSDAVVDERSYDYDLASNRTQQVINGTTRSFGYNAANQLCWAYSGASSADCDSPPSGATTYSYDANGDTTDSSAGWDFDYDERARTSNVTWPGKDLAIGFGRVGADRSAPGQLPGNDRHNTLLGLSREGGTSWTRDPNGLLVSQRASGGEHHYYLTDSLGSIVGLADESGELARGYEYDPFGRLRSNSGEAQNPFQFAGQYREPENDVYRIGDRYYSAALGRWAQIDPLDRAGDLRHGNRYVYEGADPVNLLDPTGATGDSAIERLVEFEAPPEEAEEPEDPELPPAAETDVIPLHEATEFLYTGSDPVQTGVDPETIEAQRAAVIRGAVRSTAGSPIAGVTVSAPEHPEYGATTTDAEGEFSYAVNGGSQLIVRLEKTGYLPVDRQVDVPWQDYVWVDDVVLTSLDPNGTEIDLSSPLSPLQVARGGAETDDDGTRQATLIFPPDTSAEMVMPNGTELPLDELTVRATEYTVGSSGPDAMPAPLPANSAYTYAAEFSVDEAMAAGAADVRFSQFLASYTENFLDFPTGQAVPAGYYDREQGAWVPAPDGRVVEVIAETGGAAVLDVTGSGDPATPLELDELGVTDDELAELADLYAPGDSLWRVPVDHFTPWDYNWPFWIPDEWIAPDGSIRPRDINECCTSSGSVIETENQTLGEDLALTGSDLGLHYRSDRVSGRRIARVVDIPLVGGSVPPGLSQVRLSVQIAGQRFTQSFDPEPNLSHRFEWDGLDAFGRRANGGQEATIGIDYSYDSTLYGAPGGTGGASFGRPPDVRLAGPDARYTRDESQSLKVTLGGYERPPGELGGWTLSSHHHYDPVAQVLDMGDGRRRSAQSIGFVADVVAGVPTSSPTLMSLPPEEEGLVAEETEFEHLQGIAVGADGSVYVADAGKMVIYRMGLDGELEAIAGVEDEERDFGELAGDGGPATEAEFAALSGMDVGPDGSIYVADLHRIRKIGPDGTITTIAGQEADPEELRFGGDGGPAVDAFFNRPEGVDVAPDGAVYVADTDNHRVRRIGTDGVVTTVAGSGPFGEEGGDFAGDGDSATQARLAEPHDVEVASGGEFYVADYGNNRVRRVAADGRIETIAGDGDNNETDYGVDATGTSIEPRGLELDVEGRLLVAAESAIARVDLDGVVRKVAGLGSASGGGTPADRVELVCPEWLAAGQGTDLYLTDPCVGVVRRIRSSLPEFDDTDLAVPSPDAEQIFQFDARGRHLSTRDAATGAVLASFSYDGEGRLVSIEDGDGLETTIERDSEGMPTAIEAPFGQRTELDQDANGYLARITNPAAEETVFDHAPDGLLESLTTSEEHETTFTYDSYGRLERDDNAADGFKELARTERPAGFEVALETKLGRSSTYEVDRLADDSMRRRETDPAGFERTLVEGKDGTTTAEEPDGTIRRSERGGDPRFGLQAPFSPSTEIETPDGRLAGLRASRRVNLADPSDPLSVESIRDRVSVNFAQTTAEFDVSESALEVETPEGRTVTTEVDDQRRPLSVTAPGIEPIVHSRDAFGRIESTTQGTRTTDFDYDPLGRLELVTDALDREHGFEYDDADRVVGETLPDGREIEFSYDDDGNLASVTPPSRPAHQFDRTPLGQTDAYTPPDLGSGPQPTIFDWSDDRELLEIAKPGGRVVEFDYDAGGRLNTIAHSGGETSFDYDTGTGTLASASAAGGEQTAFEWDGFLPLGETTSGTVDGEVSRTFDDRFQIASESVDGGNTVPYYYDEDGLMVQAGEVILYRDPDNGLLTGAEHGSVSTGIDRDAFGDPERVGSMDGATVLYEEEYERDDLGRIVEKVERRGVQTTLYEYGYDLGGRLETVTVDGLLAATYSYDANGNRVGVARTGEFPVVGVYDAQDRLMSYGAATYSHDASGQLESKTEGSDTTSYDYDDVGSLKGVTLPGGEEIDYAIDASGHRVAKKVDGVLEQGFLYGRGLGPVAELDGSGDLRSRFVYGTRANVPEYMVQGGQTYRILVDQVGSPRAVVDVASGVVAQEMDFDEFGRVTRDTNPGFQPFGFAGGLYDSDTGLVRFGARDYDPETGRWTAKDPIDFAGGDANLYGYVLGDPVNWSDPHGLFLMDVVNAIDAVTPDFVSNAAAGFIDSWTLGGTSTVFGVNSWCGASGYGFGAFLGNVNPRGVIRKGLSSFASRSLPRRGRPNSTDVLDRGNGSGQIRDYGPDGMPRKDFDFGHHHGVGDPHAHDWVDGRRSGGRPIRPGE